MASKKSYDKRDEIMTWFSRRIKLLAWQFPVAMKKMTSFPTGFDPSIADWWIFVVGKKGSRISAAWLL